ncbi:MAG: hypothetical protein SF066_16160 [Thermoanaerobaculia bacterium]|nr:hypothetical protein [Thermoanaerobaculia bacterium]
MSNQNDSSDFQERDHFLRRTFAWRFRDPEDLAAVIRLGEILQTWIYELNQFGPDDDDDLEVMDEDFRAAGQDLLLIAAYLRSKAAERFESGLDEASTRRCERAECWAEQAEALGKLILDDVAQDDGDDAEE